MNLLAGVYFGLVLGGLDEESPDRELAGGDVASFPLQTATGVNPGS